VLERNSPHHTILAKKTRPVEMKPPAPPKMVTPRLTGASTTTLRVVDIGVNLTNRAFRSHWKEVVQRSIDAGVDTLILTGTDLQQSQQCLSMCQEWLDDMVQRTSSDQPVADDDAAQQSPSIVAPARTNLYCTIGVHPHDAKTWSEGDDCDAGTKLKELLQHPLAVAVGECGLDYNRNYSSPQQQQLAFRRQLEIACEMNMPVFVHEREAFDDTIRMMDEVQTRHAALPPVVVHCFTGTEAEAQAYVDRGYYVGFTGTICKAQRGAPLREFLPRLPLDKIMLETDAPFMGFKKGRKRSEPADCLDVARRLAEVLDVSVEDVCAATTRTALGFFRLPN